MLRSHLIVLLLSFAPLMLICCDKEEEHRKHVTADYQKRLPKMIKSGIVAGPEEGTFEENQGVKLHLPMPEDQFVALLKRLKLEYEVVGERGTQMIIPTPWHSDKLDISPMQRAYQIYGQPGRLNPRLPGQEMYRAYVDKSGRVVYIENMFGYDGL
jgi:hypothetical protein